MRNCKDLVIYFARYDRGKSVGILSRYYYELIGKIDEYKGSKYLITDDILYEVLDNIKKIINTELFDDIKILIDTDDKLPDVILIAFLIKDRNKFIHTYF